MELSLYIVITIGVVILLLLLVLAVYFIGIACAEIKNQFFNSTDVDEYVIDTCSDSRARNSVLCDLKRRFRNEIKDFCHKNELKSISVNSGEYGSLMAKVGYEYFYDLVSQVEIDQQIVDQNIANRILLLKELVPKLKDKSSCVVFDENTIEFELRNVRNINSLLDNILELTENICVQSDVDLIKMYHMKFQYVLSFIHHGLVLMLRGIDNLIDTGNAHETNDRTRFFLDNIAFTTISLHEVENYVH
ncbi:hypothetical protein EDL79_04035 [Ehrlichia ruminantium]|uniref:Uncharacterized protein n=1 Tax=Ehrlichia ruminantium TaxID=779 RepID=A0AAE6Q9I7_EHRRU|nr:hypothetical protein [Ehrlichia ruminantium]QGR02785.1 hypothetical protein EDL81_04025 [Ehrlichia ruminantium]QGR03706.1 hypothetical protein EDL80_04025 [Ehrlichia ruminantium]QGR04633.1 hypothetical protein EDL79_04035 [Ehrlichia ruminantium]